MASRKSIENKVAGSPRRSAARAYHGARPGYSIEEVEGRRVFHPDEVFGDDDDQRVTEKLVKSGVNEPFDDEDHPDERDEDREFALGRQAYLTQARHEHLAEEQGLDAEDDIADDEELQARLAEAETEGEAARDDETLELDLDDEDFDAEVRQGTMKAERNL